MPEELLDVVDEKNEVVGVASYDEVYEKRLNHRITHVLVFNDKGEVFLTQSSAKRRFRPGHWGTSAGGHVQKGETYEDAAKRELKAQLGVEGELTKVHESPYDHYKMRKFLEVFRCIAAGPFQLNADELADGKWFTIADVKDMVKKNQMVYPELAHIIDKLYS